MSSPAQVSGERTWVYFSQDWGRGGADLGVVVTIQLTTGSYLLNPPRPLAYQWQRFLSTRSRGPMIKDPC